MTSSDREDGDRGGFGSVSTVATWFVALLVALVLGALVISCMCISGLPARAGAQSCQANLRCFFGALQGYVEDHGVPQYSHGRASWAQFLCAKLIDIKQCYCPMSSFHVDTSVKDGVLGGVLFDPVSRARDATAYPPVPWTGVTMFGYAGRSVAAPIVASVPSPATTPLAMCDPTQDGDRHGGRSIVLFYDGHTEVGPYTPTFTGAWGPGRVDLRVLSNCSGF